MWDQFEGTVNVLQVEKFAQLLPSVKKLQTFREKRFNSWSVGFMAHATL